MNLGTDTLAQAIQGKLTRNILFLTAILVSITAYTYIVEFYDPNANFLKQIWRGIVQESYTFHSGAEGGFYIQVGKLLEKETVSNVGIKIYNEESSGGFENAVSVASSASAFGLLQEDTLTEKDSLRERLRFITPLYVERMHVLYRRDKCDPNIAIRLSPHDDAAKKLFQDVKISTGPHGSGSKVFSSYLLSQCEFRKVEDLNLSFKEALTRLETGDVGVVFTIAGAPLRDVKEIIERNKNIGLMSIDPTIIPELNRTFGLRLRPTTFKEIYEGGEKISTIGSYAFLIASKDVPNSAIMELLSVLDRSKHKMEGYNEHGNFPLDQFDYMCTFKKEYQGFRMELLRNLFIFIVSVVGTTAAAMTFLVWITSEYKQVNYFRDIIKVYSECLPTNTNLDEQKGAFPKPIIYENQNAIISELVRGIARLLSVAQKIRRDYKSGGITMTHYRHLLDSLYEIKDIFQRNLAQRLNEVLEQKLLPKKEQQELLRCYYTAGYLKLQNYRDLLVVIEAKGG